MLMIGNRNRNTVKPQVETIDKHVIDMLAWLKVICSVFANGINIIGMNLSTNCFYRVDYIELRLTFICIYCIVCIVHLLSSVTKINVNRFVIALCW